MASQLKFEQLIRRYGLTAGDYSKTITDQHLTQITSSCWKKLPTYRGLPTQAVADIEKGQGDEGEKQYAFFLLWKQTNGFEATYKQLINALLVNNHKRDAEDVCSLLKESLPMQPRQSSTLCTCMPPPQASSLSTVLLAQPTELPGGSDLPSNQPPGILPMATSASPSMPGTCMLA